MKVTALFYTLLAATVVSASAVPPNEFQVLDTCGSGYGGDQRRQALYSARAASGLKSGTATAAPATAATTAELSAKLMPASALQIGLEWSSLKMVLGNKSVERFNIYQSAGFFYVQY
ncbi:hypothetical protein BBP40_003142 [Aspergillus hancockii]|nr:hypothetical protein BBP40_003142 [Aspergillus hancockii]